MIIVCRHLKTFLDIFPHELPRFFSTCRSKVIFEMSKVDETPELVGEAALFLPSVPVAANIALKPPIFLPNAAEVWFAQADAQFAIRTVTVSKTKFYLAVASLPQDVAAQIFDLISAPPTGNP